MIRNDTGIKKKDWPPHELQTLSEVGCGAYQGLLPVISNSKGQT